MILILILVLFAAAFVGVVAAISAKAERYMDDIVKKTLKRQRTTQIERLKYYYYEI